MAGHQANGVKAMDSVTRVLGRQDSGNWRFSLRKLFVAVAILGSLFGFIGGQLRVTIREQRAYRQLCALGATGDDWVGWRELFLGRNYAPIVEIQIPPTLDLDKALPLLSDLDNLEALDLTGCSIADSHLVSLSSLRTVKSLRLARTGIGDERLPLLTKFDHLRWLYVDGAKMSAEGLRQLQRDLPDCRIEPSP
jgi:hypothetical protein